MHKKSRFSTPVGRNTYPKIYFHLLILAALLLTSCNPRVVTVDRYHNTETVRQVHDSIYYADTVLLDARADTVMIEVTKWRTKTTVLRDTIRVVDTTAVDGQSLNTIILENQSLKAQRAAQTTKTQSARLITALLAFALIFLLIYTALHYKLKS